MQTQDTEDSKEQERSHWSFQLSTEDSMGDTFYKIKEGIFIYYKQIWKIIIKMKIFLKQLQ